MLGCRALARVQILAVRRQHLAKFRRPLRGPLALRVHPHDHPLAARVIGILVERQRDGKRVRVVDTLLLVLQRTES